MYPLLVGEPVMITTLGQLSDKEPLLTWKNGRHLFIYNRYGYVYYQKGAILKQLKLISSRVYGDAVPLMRMRDIMTSVMCSRTEERLAINWKLANSISC